MYINIINKVENSIKNSKIIDYIYYMKRVLIIFVLLVAFNFSTPDSNLMVLRHRHLIEFSQGEHTKSLSENEVIKNKAALYLKLYMIMYAAERMGAENRGEFDSS